MSDFTQKAKPRFYDAQPGDLIWNDERGICEVTKHFCNDPKFPTLGIIYSCGNGYECICLDGRSCISSPKATFFYYTPENHYLTERPEPQIDWAKVPEGTQVIPWDDKEPRTDNNENYHESFMAYLPHLEYPFWVYYEGSVVKDNARGFKHCKLAEPCKPEWIK